jgi:hypothetical protein
MSVLKEPDWDAAEALLIEECIRAVENFSARYPGVTCSFFAIVADYCFGDVVLCFDTYDNNLLQAKRHEARTLKERDAVLRDERGWENAKYFIQREQLCDHTPHTAEFKYPNLTKLHFPEWEDYFGNDQLPEHPDPMGHVVVMLHKVVSKLVETGCFNRLAMSSPFRVGAEFPRDECGLIILRLLNWPSHQGPRN